MLFILTAIVGMIGGAVCVYALLNPKLSRVEAQRVDQEKRAKQLKEKESSINSESVDLSERAIELRNQTEQLRVAREEFDARKVKYVELQNENVLLKRDLQNIDVNLRKLEMDREIQGEKQEAISTEVEELGGRYLKENVKWISASLSANNFANCKQRLLDVIERCRGIGLTVTTAQEETLVADLRSEFEMAVRAEIEREEQARIKAQIREEQKLQMEIDRELKQLERERLAVQAALEKALAAANGQHSAEVESLQAKLAEAEARSQRAISQAQLTKAGHVYIISNIGSFGEGVFKIGMTCRLEPRERIQELSTASVPFPFDVHMMISSNNAPSLENSLHRLLHKFRVNRANPRKEYFRTDIETICRFVKENHGEVQYVADAAALEYRQSLTMSDSDLDYIGQVYERVEKDIGVDGDVE